MNFDEAFDCLNRFDITSVAREMADWHPAILGQMLLAVEAAKKTRYPLYHPDYYEPLQAVLAAESPGQGSTSSQRPRWLTAAIMRAVKRLEERR